MSGCKTDIGGSNSKFMVFILVFHVGDLNSDDPWSGEKLIDSLPFSQLRLPIKFQWPRGHDFYILGSRQNWGVRTRAR